MPFFVVVVIIGYCKVLQADNNQSNILFECSYKR